MSGEPELKPGEDYYTDPEGRFVFTEAYHRRRGYCCENGCLHCPYGNALSLGRRFALRLDQNDFSGARPFLAEDCSYLISGREIRGRDEILKSYEQSYLSGKDLLDEIQFESAVSLSAPERVLIEYLDRLRKGSRWHEHRCRQELVFSGGKIVQINHIEIAGENESLSEFFRQVGIKR